ncbi:hypothetical protein [Bartonella sp. OD88NMGDW]
MGKKTVSLAMRQQFVELCCGTHMQSGCYDGTMLLSSIMIW